MKKKIIAVAFLFVLAFIPLVMSKRLEHINDNTQLDTFISGGHQFDIVHSKLCKCHK